MIVYFGHGEVDVLHLFQNIGGEIILLAVYHVFPSEDSTTVCLWLKCGSPSCLRKQKVGFGRIMCKGRMICLLLGALETIHSFGKLPC